MSLTSILTAKLYLRDRKSASQVTVFLSNTNISHLNTSTVTTSTIFPIIKNIPEINYSASDFLPTQQNISVNIENDYHTVGYTRKFTDLLQQYQIIQQSIEVFYTEYSIYNVPAITEFYNSSNRVFAGIVTSLADDPRNDRFSLKCESATLPKTIFSRELKIDSDFPSLPDKSLGKALPIVLGEDQRFPVHVINANSTGTTLNSGGTSQDCIDVGIASTLAGFPMSALTKLLVKQGDYTYEVDMNTVSFCDTPLTNGWISYTGNVPISVNDTYEVNYNYFGTTKNLITHIAVSFDGSASYIGTPAGKIFIDIINSRSNPTYQERIVLDKSFLFWINTNTTNRLILQLPKILIGTGSLWVKFSHEDQNSANTLNVVAYSHLNSALVIFNGGIGMVNQRAIIEPYITSMRQFESSVDANGKRFSYIKIGAYNGESTELLADLEYGARSAGLTDASGVYTTAGQVLKNPYNQIQLLSSTYNGSAWTNPTVDITNFSNSYSTLQRTTGIFSKGREFADELILQVLKSAQAKLFPSKPTGSIGSLKTLNYWQYGYRNTPITTITDEDLKSLSYEIRDAKTIVNNFILFYKPNYLNATTSSVTLENNAKNYEGYISGSNGTSQAVYGVKDLQDNKYDGLNDATSAQNVVTAILSNYAEPFEYFICDVVYSRFKTLKCGDIVEVKTPRLPSFGGSDPDPELSHYNGVESSELGTQEVLAKTYRCQIESITYNLLTEKTSTIRLVLRIVTALNELL